MHRPHLLNLLFFFLTLFTISAQDGMVFGKVPPSDLNMKTYDADTTANALVLYEKGDAAIRLDSQNRTALFYERMVRVKIFNDNGMDEATIEIPLYKSLSDKNRKETLQKVEAIVINPDRTVGRISIKNVYYEDLRENLVMASFTMPNVQEGAIIDYRYEVKSPFLYNFQSWEFQSHLPKLHSEYNTSIPGNYQYNIKITGPLKLSSHRTDLKRKCFTISGLGSSDCAVNHYVMNHIPAFREEKHMTAKVNHLSALRFEMTTFQDFRGYKEYYSKSWETVDKELRGETIGKESQKDSWFKKNLPEDLLTGTADLDKAKKIFYFVKDHLYWNGNDHLFREFSVKDTWEEGSGSSTAINMALLNALKAGGFNTQPVLVSTRNNGFPSREIPAISDFNALVIKLDIGELSYLLDAANKHMPFAMLRKELLNVDGRVMDFKKGSYWYPLLQRSVYSKKSFQASIDLTENKAQVREISNGYYALEKRDELTNMSLEAFEDDLANTLEKRGDFTLIDFKNTGIEDPEKTLVTSYELELNRDLSKDKILLNPFILHAYNSSPFKLNQRTYPVDFGHPFSLHYMILINLGEEFELLDKPQNKSFQLPDNGGRLLYNITRSGQQLTVKLQMDIFKSIIPSTHYEALKEFFNEFVSLQTKKPITLSRPQKLMSENAEN